MAPCLKKRNSVCVGDIVNNGYKNVYDVFSLSRFKFYTFLFSQFKKRYMNIDILHLKTTAMNTSECFCLAYTYRDYFIFKETAIVNDDCSDLMVYFFISLGLVHVSHTQSAAYC